MLIFVLKNYLPLEPVLVWVDSHGRRPATSWANAAWTAIDSQEH